MNMSHSAGGQIVSAQSQGRGVEAVLKPLALNIEGELIPQAARQGRRQTGGVQGQAPDRPSAQPVPSAIGPQGGRGARLGQGLEPAIAPLPGGVDPKTKWLISRQTKRARDGAALSFQGRDIDHQGTASAKVEGEVEMVP